MAAERSSCPGLQSLKSARNGGFGPEGRGPPASSARPDPGPLPFKRIAVVMVVTVTVVMVVMVRME